MLSSLSSLSACGKIGKWEKLCCKNIIVQCKMNRLDWEEEGRAEETTKRTIYVGWIDKKWINAIFYFLYSPFSMYTCVWEKDDSNVPIDSEISTQ